MIEKYNNYYCNYNYQYEKFMIKINQNMPKTMEFHQTVDLILFHFVHI